MLRCDLPCMESTSSMHLGNSSHHPPGPRRCGSWSRRARSTTCSSAPPTSPRPLPSAMSSCAPPHGRCTRDCVTQPRGSTLSHTHADAGSGRARRLVGLADPDTVCCAPMTFSVRPPGHCVRVARRRHTQTHKNRTRFPDSGKSSTAHTSHLTHRHTLCVRRCDASGARLAAGAA